MIVVRIAYHLLPLITLTIGLRWLTVAMILLVLISYIKVKKIEQQLKDLSVRKADPVELEGLRRTRDFWLNLTFLSKKQGWDRS